jgi:hypothetical protein
MPGQLGVISVTDISGRFSVKDAQPGAETDIDSILSAFMPLQSL